MSCVSECRPGERLLEMANQQQKQAGVPAQKTQLDAEVCVTCRYIMENIL